MKILLFGPQGSGKSTQGKRLAAHLKVEYLSTGDIFRAKREEDSDDGRRFKQLLEQGLLVDDETTAKIVSERVSLPQFEPGYVMDGYPRTLPQLRLFNPSFDRVIFIDVPRDELVQRLLARGRDDDRLESINQRLNDYYAMTQPLLDEFEKEGIIAKVQGTGSEEDVYQRVLAAIGDRDE